MRNPNWEMNLTFLKFNYEIIVSVTTNNRLYFLALLRHGDGGDASAYLVDLVIVDNFQSLNEFTKWSFGNDINFLSG